MRVNPEDDDVDCLEFAGELDPHAVEAVRLELRRLARQHGLSPKDFRIEIVADERRPEPPAPDGPSSDRD